MSSTQSMLQFWCVPVDACVTRTSKHGTIHIDHTDVVPALVSCAWLAGSRLGTPPDP